MTKVKADKHVGFDIDALDGLEITDIYKNGNELVFITPAGAHIPVSGGGDISITSYAINGTLVSPGSTVTLSAINQSHALKEGINIVTLSVQIGDLTEIKVVWKGANTLFVKDTDHIHMVNPELLVTVMDVENEQPYLGHSVDMINVPYKGVAPYEAVAALLEILAKSNVLPFVNEDVLTALVTDVITTRCKVVYEVESFTIEELHEFDPIEVSVSGVTVTAEYRHVLEVKPNTRIFVDGGVCVTSISNDNDTAPLRSELFKACGETESMTTASMQTVINNALQEHINHPIATVIDSRTLASTVCTAINDLVTEWSTVRGYDIFVIPEWVEPITLVIKGDRYVIKKHRSKTTTPDGVVLERLVLSD